MCQKLFKNIFEGTDSLFEIRIQQGSDIFRISFFCEGKLIILSTASKKTQKTPKSEIEKALKIKKEYETEK